MPGRTPPEAFRAFIEPIERALSCVGSGKILTSTGGNSVAAVNNNPTTHSWVLNGQGMPLRGEVSKQRLDLVFKASMRYRIIPTDEGEEGNFRVTTRGYMYSVEDQSGQEIMSWHWHPNGSSPWKSPHFHNGPAILNSSGVITPKAHLPSGRISFENIVRLLIHDLGVEPRRETWAEDLAFTEGIFKLYRKWSDSPPEVVLSDAQNA